MKPPSRTPAPLAIEADPVLCVPMREVEHIERSKTDAHVFVARLSCGAEIRTSYGVFDSTAFVCSGALFTGCTIQECPRESCFIRRKKYHES